MNCTRRVIRLHKPTKRRRHTAAPSAVKRWHKEAFVCNGPFHPEFWIDSDYALTVQYVCDWCEEGATKSQAEQLPTTEDEVKEILARIAAERSN